MEKQRTKKEKVRLQKDAAAAAPLSAGSAQGATRSSGPGPVPREQSTTETRQLTSVGLGIPGAQLQQGKPELPVQ